MAAVAVGESRDAGLLGWDCPPGAVWPATSLPRSQGAAPAGTGGSGGLSPAWPGLQPGCPPAPPRAPQGLMASLKRQAGPGPARPPAGIYGGICLGEGFITAVKEPSVCRGRQCRGPSRGGLLCRSLLLMGSLSWAPSGGAVPPRMWWDAAAAWGGRACSCAAALWDCTRWKP